jgi:hypothetical protein
MTISVVLLIVAIALFIIAALGVSADRFNLMAAGLAFFAASFLF